MPPLDLTMWRHSVEQADAADWITVASYLIAAVLTWLAARAAGVRREPRDRLFWQLSTLLLVFLGANELLDLQALLTVIGKAWAKAGGWYEQRRTFQLEFIVALAAATALGGLAAVYLTRCTRAAVRVALLGFLFIGLFVLIRAASFHHIDQMMGMGPSAFNWGSVQEMLGIAIVAAAAWVYARRPAPARRRGRR